MEYQKSHRIFKGLIFIIVAIMLLIGKSGCFGSFNIWSLILTILLCAIIIKSIYPINFGGILFPIAFLCIIYNKELGIEELTPAPVLIAAAFGTIGLSLIFQGNFPYHSNSHNSNKDCKFVVLDEDDESHITQKTLFGGITKYINSDDFKQANLECTCGSMEIYFDKAHIKSEKAVVQINAACSSIELFVPKEWTIENRLSTTFSGIDEKNNNCSDNSITLVLTGEITLSNITITFI